MTTHKNPKQMYRNSADSTVDTQSNARNKWVALVLSIFLGEFGIDRFYLGKVGTGILKLVTFGGFGVWWIIDVVLIAADQMKDANGQPLNISNPIGT